MSVLLHDVKGFTGSLSYSVMRCHTLSVKRHEGL